MLTDLWTMIRKDIREVLMARNTGKRGSGWMSLLIFVGLLGILMPIQTGLEWVNNPILPLVWSWIPVFLVVSVVTDSFAGERERNTLETLLASRLSDRAILFGKIGASVLYGWGLGVVANLVGVVTINIMFFDGKILFYQPLPYVGFLVASFLISLLMSSIGVLVSLNAPTARSAYQRLSIFMLAVWFLPTLFVTFVPEEMKGSISKFFMDVNLTQLAVGGLVFILLLDVVLVMVAMQRFQRAKLILN